MSQQKHGNFAKKLEKAGISIILPQNLDRYGNVINKNKNNHNQNQIPLKTNNHNDNTLDKFKQLSLNITNQNLSK